MQLKPWIGLTTFFFSNVSPCCFLFLKTTHIKAIKRGTFVVCIIFTLHGKKKYMGNTRILVLYTLHCMKIFTRRVYVFMVCLPTTEIQSKFQYVLLGMLSASNHMENSGNFLQGVGIPIHIRCIPDWNLLSRKLVTTYYSTAAGKLSPRNFFRQ